MAIFFYLTFRFCFRWKCICTAMAQVCR